MRGGLADGGERGAPLWLSSWNMDQRRFHSHSNFSYWNVWLVFITRQVTTTIMWIFTQILCPATAGTKDSAFAHAFDRWRMLCVHHGSSRLGPALKDCWVTQKTSVEFNPKVPALPAVLRIVDLPHGRPSALIMPLLSRVSLQCWNIPKP